MARRLYWLLDTCVVSELTRKDPDSAVVAWLAANAHSAAISMVTLGEITYGIERLTYGIERLTPGPKSASLRIWLDGLCKQFGDRLLLTDESTWRRFGTLKAVSENAGRRRQDLDLLIAATASAHQLAVVTRNVKHFEGFGIEITNPWTISHKFQTGPARR